MGWALLGGSILLAVFHSPWWWALVVLLGGWRANQWYFYNGRPWRKVHFPIMRAYTRAAAIETVAAQKATRDFDVRNAATELVKQLNRDWEDSRARNYVEEQISRCQSLEDEELIVKEFRRRNAKLDDSEIKQVRKLARELLIPPDNSTVVRFIVASVVEQHYGPSHRAEYLVEVLKGNAT